MRDYKSGVFVVRHLRKKSDLTDIMREQQRSTCTTCVEVGGRTLLRLRKPSVGSAATRNRPKTAWRAAQDRPPRRRWRRRSSCAHSTKSPFTPHPAALRWHSGRATPSLSAIATSETISAPLQGQERQRCGGAPSSGTTRRLTGGESLTPYFDYCQEHATHLPDTYKPYRTNRGTGLLYYSGTSTVLRVLLVYY